MAFWYEYNLNKIIRVMEKIEIGKGVIEMHYVVIPKQFRENNK